MTDDLFLALIALIGITGVFGVLGWLAEVVDEWIGKWADSD